MFNDSEYYSQTFSDLSASGSIIEGVEFDGCTFKECDFSAATFKQCKFIECTFSNCNLSNINLGYSKFSDTRFEDSKVIGADWNKATWPTFPMPAAISFHKCILNDSSFSGLDLAELCVEECKVHDVDFREANLHEANFRYSDLSHSLFIKTVLNEADFTEAMNYDINILENRVKDAKFSRFEAVNLLENLGIELVD